MSETLTPNQEVLESMKSAPVAVTLENVMAGFKIQAGEIELGPIPGRKFLAVLLCVCGAPRGKLITATETFTNVPVAWDEDKKHPYVLGVRFWGRERTTDEKSGLGQYPLGVTVVSEDEIRSQIGSLLVKQPKGSAPASGNVPAAKAADTESV